MGLVIGVFIIFFLLIYLVGKYERDSKNEDWHRAKMRKDMQKIKEHMGIDEQKDNTAEVFAEFKKRREEINKEFNS